VDNVIKFAINIFGNAADRITSIASATQNATAHVQKFTALTQHIRDVGLAFQAVDNAVGALTGALSSCKQAYMEESVAITRLTQLMRNNIHATDDEIQSIQDLASAQQKLGVIGDETQLSGAQELSTYLSKTDSLKRLIPAMNDMLAQQYGLNATQEQAVTIAQMMGKVLDGQVGALSRYGYRFDEAQEKVLKFGTEEEKVAMLSGILTKYVGGVNEALAATPEGALKNQANNAGDLQERIGKLVVELQAKLMPVVARLMDVADKVVTFIEKNSEAITALAVAIGAVILVVKGWIVVQGIINTLLMLNPIGIIIGFIVALIAVIAYLVIKIKGWGTIWDAVTGSCKNITLAFVESIKLAFTSMVNGIMIAIDKIKIGWYKFKMAVGIGDDSESRAMISEINADVEKRKKAIVDGAKKVADYVKEANKAAAKASLSWDNNVTLKSTADKLKRQLGITDNTQVTNNTQATNNDLSQDMSTTTTSIAQGGKSVKNFNITINDGLIKQVDNHFGSSNENPESAGDFMWRLSQALQMILNDVNYAA
jgi:hypothetical protein